MRVRRRQGPGIVLEEIPPEDVAEIRRLWLEGVGVYPPEVVANLLAAAAGVPAALVLRICGLADSSGSAS